MIEDWKAEFSERLHRAAEAWGIEVLPGRPLVGLCTYDVEVRKIDGIAGNPYQPNMALAVEEHSVTLPTNLGVYSHATVRLFTFNDRWGFSTNYSIENRGSSYGNWIHMSNPYHTSDDALRAGVRALAAYAEGSRAQPYINAWLCKLMAPQQLGLFNHE